MDGWKRASFGRQSYWWLPRLGLTTQVGVDRPSLREEAWLVWEHLDPYFEGTDFTWDSFEHTWPVWRENDFYAALVLAQNASPREIKVAFHHLAMTYHPDKYQQNSHANAAFFKTVQEAYDVLRNTAKRQAYDHFWKELHADRHSRVKSEHKLRHATECRRKEADARIEEEKRMEASRRQELEEKRLEDKRREEAQRLEDKRREEAQLEEARVAEERRLQELANTARQLEEARVAEERRQQELANTARQLEEARVVEERRQQELANTARQQKLDDFRRQAIQEMNEAGNNQRYRFEILRRDAELSENEREPKRIRLDDQDHLDSDSDQHCSSRARAIAMQDPYLTGDRLLLEPEEVEQTRQSVDNGEPVGVAYVASGVEENAHGTVEKGDHMEEPWLECEKQQEEEEEQEKEDAHEQVAGHAEVGMPDTQDLRTASACSSAAAVAVSQPGIQSIVNGAGAGGVSHAAKHVPTARDYAASVPSPVVPPARHQALRRRFRFPLHVEFSRKKAILVGQVSRYNVPVWGVDMGEVVCRHFKLRHEKEMFMVGDTECFKFRDDVVVGAMGGNRRERQHVLGLVLVISFFATKGTTSKSVQQVAKLVDAEYANGHGTGLGQKQFWGLVKAAAVLLDGATRQTA